MSDALAGRPASPDQAGAGTASRGAGSGRLRRAGPYLGLVPFFVYIAIFLLFPTLIVVVGAFQDASGLPTTGNIGAVLGEEAFRRAFIQSIELAIVTALAGAILGGLLAWAVATGDPDGLLRQVVVAASGVLAQFGGVMLAFAFLATFGFTGFITVTINGIAGFDVFGGSTWLYSLGGLAVVYTYFQIPLMVIVFLPALDGLRREWLDASASLGGTTWSYWRHIGGPILAPSFLGALLLLFTNAFAAYATARALISQGAPLITLQIGNTMSSEVILGQANVGKAMALGMIVIVSLTMLLYAYIQRRASRWVR